MIVMLPVTAALVVARVQDLGVREVRSQPEYRGVQMHWRCKNARAACKSD